MNYVEMIAALEKALASDELGYRAREMAESSLRNLRALARLVIKNENDIRGDIESVGINLSKFSK